MASLPGNEKSSASSGDSFELFFHGLTDHLQVGRHLVGHACDLEASAQIEDHDVWKLPNEIEVHLRDLEPDFRIAPRPNVCVDAGGGQIVSFEERLDLRDPFVPDSETGGGTTDIGAIVAS